MPEGEGNGVVGAEARSGGDEIGVVVAVVRERE
jgi:hypothetical protein